SLASFFEIAGNRVVVMGFDIKAFAFAGAFAKLEGLGSVVCGVFAFAEVGVGGGHVRVSDGEGWVDGNSAAEVWDGCGEIGFAGESAFAEAVGFESFER